MITNPIGVHGLVWTGEWTAQTCRATMSRASATGYDLVEVPLLDPASVDAEMTRTVAAEHGLTTTCTLGLATGTDISSEDTAAVQAGEALLQAALDVVRRLGARYLGGVIYSAMAKYTAAATARGRANAVTVLRGLAAEAAGAGVTLGLEAVNRYESNLVNTAEQAVRLADDIAAENVTVHLDTYHMNIEERDLASPVRLTAAAGRLGYVHVGESHRGYLGSGTADLTGLFQALHDVGYAGPIVFESFSSSVVTPAFTAALAIWREPWQDSEDVAAHARRYIASQLRSAAAPALVTP